MSEGGGDRKRKSKAWYRKQAYHNKRMKTDQKAGHRLTAGLKGFIVTCNDRERDAVKESYNILNEYADKLYGPESKAEAEASGESDGDDDIEAAIAKEVQDLKEATAKGERRFQNSQTGAKNCIFIKTTLDDPVGLAYAIFTDLRQSRVQKSRHALRLLPVVGTCKANVKEISELAKVALQPFFTETKLEVTFTVTFKARNNNGVGREMVVSTVRQTIMDAFPSVLLRFTHTNPEITVLVEVMCGVACLAVAKNFALFRKYNLVEMALEKPAEAAESVENKDKSEDAAVTQSADVALEKPAEAAESVENKDKSEGAAVTQSMDSESTGNMVSDQASEMTCIEKSDHACEDGKSIPVAEAEADKVPDTTDLSSGEGSECKTASSSGESQGAGQAASSHEVCKHSGDDDKLTLSAESGAVSGEKPPNPNSPATSEQETVETGSDPPAMSH